MGVLASKGGVACTLPANRIVLQATWKRLSRKFHHFPDLFTKCQGSQLLWLGDCRNVLHRKIPRTRVSCARKCCRADWFVELGGCRRPALTGGGRILLLAGASTSHINHPLPSSSILLPLSSFIIQFHRQSNKIHSKAPRKFFASFSSTWLLLLTLEIRYPPQSATTAQTHSHSARHLPHPIILGHSHRPSSIHQPPSPLFTFYQSSITSSMSSSQLTTQYYSERPTSSSRPSHSHRRRSSTQKVSGWLQTTPPSSSNPIGYPLSPSSSPDGKKMVHWTDDVEDNEKAPRRSSTKSSTSSKSSSSSSKSSSSKKASSTSKRKSSSSSKDDSRSRAPPPTPRSCRLPTPELSDLECGEFCNCYYCRPQTAEEKMNTQRK